MTTLRNATIPQAIAWLRWTERAGYTLWNVDRHTRIVIPSARALHARVNGGSL